jgi:hypothetical protein
MSTVWSLGFIFVVRAEKVKRILDTYDWGIGFGPVSITYGVTLISSILAGSVIMWGFLMLIAIWRHDEIVAYCVSGRSPH